MSTFLVIFLSCAVAAALAWGVRRYEHTRDPAPTLGSRAVDEVFAAGTGDTDDAVLLARLLKHRREASSDARYVDQARRLMMNLQQVDEARQLLKDAERQNAFHPDELKAQQAWVDLGAAHLAWTRDQLSNAQALQDRAVAIANDLRTRWPEWPLPYRLLEEAERAAWATPVENHNADAAQLEQRARGRLLNGAWVRSLQDWRPVAFTFVVSALGLLGLAAGGSGLLALREMATLQSSPIGTAAPGYVEFKGTLQLLPNTSAVIGPFSKNPGVWYDNETNSGFKNSRTYYERSAQSFLVRDTSGEAVIEPKGMTVRTRHLAGTFGDLNGAVAHQRVHERLLKEGDVAYVLGELTVETSPQGTALRRLRVADDGRRLLVSNLSEEQLVLIEKLWLWIGFGAFTLAMLVLLWSYYQRYHVPTMPGLLS